MAATVVTEREKKMGGSLSSSSIDRLWLLMPPRLLLLGLHHYPGFPTDWLDLFAPQPKGEKDIRATPDSRWHPSLRVSVVVVVGNNSSSCARNTKKKYRRWNNGRIGLVSSPILPSNRAPQHESLQIKCPYTEYIWYISQEETPPKG